jgi:hypothetical protein
MKYPLFILILYSVSTALPINYTMLVCMGAKLCTMLMQFLGLSCSEEKLCSLQANVPISSFIPFL